MKSRKGEGLTAGHNAIKSINTVIIVELIKVRPSTHYHSLYSKAYGVWGIMLVVYVILLLADRVVLIFPLALVGIQRSYFISDVGGWNCARLQLMSVVLIGVADELIVGRTWVRRGGRRAQRDCGRDGWMRK